MIYLILLIYIIILCCKYDYGISRKYRELNYIFTCILLILVAGCRYRIGFDTINYMESFYSPYYPPLSEFSFKGDYGNDILWVFINSLAKSIGGGFYTVQFIQAAIVNIVVFWFIKRHSPKPFLGILLFFLFQWWNYCFEAMRESIAIAFYLFGLDALISENNYKKYYLRVWPAALVHTFGFITFLFPLIKYLKVNKYLPFVFAAFLILFFSISDLMNSVVDGMVGIEGMAAEKATKYIESDIYGESTLSSAGVISLFISRILPIAYLIYVLYLNKCRETDVFIPYLLCYILVVFLRIAMPIFFRFYNYFEIMLIISITQALSLPKINRNSLRHYATIVVVALMVLIRAFELTEPAGYEAYKRYFPYNSVFTQDYNEQSEAVFRAF